MRGISSSGTSLRRGEDFVPVTGSAGLDTGEEVSLLFSDVGDDSTSTNQGLKVDREGRTILLSSASDVTAQFQVAFGTPSNWKTLTPGNAEIAPESFERFFIRRPSSVASSAKKLVLKVYRQALAISQAPSPNTLAQGPVAIGSPAANPVPVGGQDAGGNQRALKQDAADNLNVNIAANTAAIPAGTNKIGKTDQATAYTAQPKQTGKAASAQLKAATGNNRLGYFTARESTGAAVAHVAIYNGTDATGGCLGLFNLNANETVRESYPDVDISAGLYLEVVSGTVDVAWSDRVIA